MDFATNLGVTISIVLLGMVVYGLGYLMGKRSNLAMIARFRRELRVLNDAYVGTCADLHNANKDRINLQAKLAKLSKVALRGPDGRFVRRAK